MRIAIITYFFPKISETFILNRITRLIDAGIDVRIFSVTSPMVTRASEDRELETIVHPDIIKYSLLERTHYLPKHNNQLDYGEIAGLFSKDKFDLIHFQWSNLAEDLLTNITFDTPVFVSFHSYLTPKSWNIKYHNFINTFKKADLILPVSNYIKVGLEKMGCQASKISVHHMGVDTELFSSVYKSKPSLIDGIIRILSVGNFVEKKGFQDAIEAVAQLRNLGAENFNYHLVGDGPLKHIFQQRLKELGLIKKVSFLGKVTQNIIIKEYEMADIMIHPSVTSNDGEDEGIPTVIMEAQSAFLPVISTLHAGIPEIIQNGKNGFLVAEHDIADLADKLRILVEHPRQRLIMGAIGRNIVLRDYNASTLNNQMVILYQQFTKNNKLKT